MKAVLLALLVSVPLLAGCFGPASEPSRAVEPADVGYDPTIVEVSGTALANATIRSWDGATDLAAMVRSPVSSTRLPDGSAPRWPVVVFLHGWGGGKESYTGGRGGVPRSGEAATGIDRLEQFARAGFVAVAYDARGFGESGGHADVAGPASMADLDSVLDWVEAHYATSGRVGVVGQSYGGGQAFLAWAGNERVTTAVPMYGWVDLPDALIPNNVPKLEWAQFLYTYGLLGAHGRYDPMIHGWYEQLYTRDDLATVRTQMATRSALPDMAGVQKPLFLCQGLQETLFPQADRAWAAAGGFTRAYVYTGGHGSGDDGCWSRTLDWFHFFLAGYDTRVDAWPALETVDVDGGRAIYEPFPTSAAMSYYLRAPDLGTSGAPDATFTVRQSPGSIVGEPSGLTDILGGGRNPIPDSLRSDPAAAVFTTTAFAGGEVILGAPVLRLHAQSGSAPFQVAAVLLRLAPDGTSQELGHAAYAVLNETEVGDGVLTLTFEWTHARLAPGDHIQLKVAANDMTWWMPLLSDYEVTFDGGSTLELPFLA